MFGAKATGDLLLNFDHPKIPLREVIVERHGKIVQEPEHGPFALGEPIKQVACRALFGPPPVFASREVAQRGWLCSLL